VRPLPGRRRRTLFASLLLLLGPLCRISFGSADGGESGAQASPEREAVEMNDHGKPARSVRVEIGCKGGETVDAIVRVLKRQVADRCGAEVLTSGDRDLVVRLSIAPGIGEEGFKIVDGADGAIDIVANDERGLLYGVGKFLRTSRYDAAGFTPGAWRGSSVPANGSRGSGRSARSASAGKGAMRGVYLATHFNNYYEAAPLAEVERTIEDLALWGFNTLIVTFPHFQFEGFDDPKARRHIERTRGLFAAAKRIGLSVGLVQAPNQSFSTTPEELRWTPIPDDWGRRGSLGVNTCPSKPAARELLTERWRRLLDAFAETGIDYVVFWPYDEGGCGCAECWPWGSKGFPSISRQLAEVARRKYPRCRFVLSTWMFDTPPAGEWKGLTDLLAKDGGWLDAIMADAHEDFPRYPLDEAVPGGLPLYNFPEISMWGMAPWGGYGANPLPRRFQRLWDQTGGKVSGGMPYSEGIYEDMNKAICAQFYWDPSRPAVETLKEYAAFEFSPDAVGEVLASIAILEKNHLRDRIGESAVEAYERIKRADAKLTRAASRSWRWRILSLRALIDCEMFRNKGRLEGQTLRRAFEELTDIQYAHHASHRPPQIAPAPAPSEAAAKARSTRLPAGVPPVLGCWFWSEKEFEPEGYREFLDMAGAHSAFNFLTTSLRVPGKEITDDDVHDRIREAAQYARERGMGVVMDLDLRLARRAFQEKHPDELQEMLRLREVDLASSGSVVLAIASDTPGDHYTSRATPYVPLSGRLVRVYSYVRGPAGIEPNTVQDITTQRCNVMEAAAGGVRVAISCDGETEGRRACVMAAFSHFTPDVFAPRLLEFQRGIIEQYADVDLAGVCKDEWGFPPCYDGCPAKNDFWYSEFRAAAYRERTGGRDLARDCLLMHLGERGREAERQRAINHFMEMSWQRNGEIEDDFYRATKAVFGPSAIVATHPTWYPYPGLREFKKNGLDWWVATRDLAQTDEVTPYCVRTSLAKKWGSPVWYNMFYSSRPGDYEKEIWSSALSGGRVNFHPVYPSPEPPGWSRSLLLEGELMRGDSRIRLLNFISKSPLDCPVAVVFGHACAMNWAGPAYDDVGIGVADGLWRAGYPADLIPSDEITRGALRVNAGGQVQYGPQRYAAVALYHPEFERPEIADFFREAAKGGTALFRVGHWTRDFEGEPIDGDSALPARMIACEDGASCVGAVVGRLQEIGIERQAPATGEMTGFNRRSCAPPTSGRCRLIDGTRILVAGERKVAGDPVQTTLLINGREVEIDAQGVAAVRLGDEGELQAMAAGGLKCFKSGALKIALDRRADVALWRDRDGQMHGVLQDWDGPVPASLRALTEDWLRLEVPPPRGEKGGG